MHDDTPGGLAVRDRAMAYWSDPERWGNAEDEAFWAVVNNG